MAEESSNSFIFACSSEADTDQLGAWIAESIEEGCVIELNGQLGAGKTRLVRAVCGSLGIDTSQVNSPTFVLLQLYTDGRVPVAHFDTYRLGDIDEFLAIGADEYTGSNEWLCLIEWAERVSECLPEDRLRVDITATGEHTRRFVINSMGPFSAAVLRRIRDFEGQLPG